MKPFLVLLLLITNFVSNKSPQADIIDDLLVQFRTGSSKDIAKNFAGAVEMIIIDQEDVYNKAQS